MIRKFALSVLLVTMSGSLTACSDAEVVDPYQTVTLSEVTRSTVVSAGFRYKLVNPEVVTLSRNIGLIREGNILEFIGARALGERLAGKTNSHFELNVVKKFSPYVHFRVEEIVTETDTVDTRQRGAINFPIITTPDEYGVANYEERDLDRIPYNDTGVLRKLLDKKIRVKGKVVVEKADGKEQYFFEAAKAKFRIADPSDSIDLFMKYYLEKGYGFEGGITMTDVEEFAKRRSNKIAGTVEINYIMYGDRLITG